MQPGRMHAAVPAASASHGLHAAAWAEWQTVPLLLNIIVIMHIIIMYIVLMYVIELIAQYWALRGEGLLLLGYQTQQYMLMDHGHLESERPAMDSFPLPFYA